MVNLVKNTNALKFLEYHIFLAAMSSSRSDGVTQSVRSFVRSFVLPYPFFPLVSIESLGVSRKF